MIAKPQKKMNKIVTIGRQIGSGGRELGKIIAQKTGFAFYDKQIVAQIAQRTQFSPEYVSTVLEQEPEWIAPVTVGHSFVDGTLFDSNVMGQAVLNTTLIYKEQHKLIRELAAKGNCVIVGRCADFILADMQPLRLFCYASIEKRLARCRAMAPEDEHLNDNELMRKMKEVDSNRAAYYNFCTDQEWGRKRNYDMCINTSQLSMEKIANAVKSVIVD